MINFFPIVRKNNRPIRPFFGNFSWDVLDRFFDGIDPTSLAKHDEWMPNIDVSESDDHVTIKVEVPGVDKKDLTIAVSEGLLTIRGEKKFQNEEKYENYHRIESRYGSFSRSLRLPAGVDFDKIEAKHKDGVLEVKVPKSEKAKPKAIEITQ